jgi:histidine triad (HIT) family protein
MEQRVAFDAEGYAQRVVTDSCFICAMQRGDPGYEHELIAADDAHIAFLSRYPTLAGYALVSPKAHLEQVVADFGDDAFLAMMAFVRRVAQGVEAALPRERTYLLSLGSQQGNAHVHWHIAALPPGVPYHEQQYHALMAEHGILATSPDAQAELASRIRAAMPPAARYRHGATADPGAGRGSPSGS